MQYISSSQPLYQTAQHNDSASFYRPESSAIATASIMHRQTALSPLFRAGKKHIFLHCAYLCLFTAVYYCMNLQRQDKAFVIVISFQAALCR